MFDHRLANRNRLFCHSKYHRRLNPSEQRSQATKNNWHDQIQLFPEDIRARALSVLGDKREVGAVMALNNDCVESAKKYNRIIIQKKCKNQMDECAICLDSHYMKTVAYLPCGHAFHHACVQQAFAKNLYSCPLCRSDLVEALLKTNFQFPVAEDDTISTHISTHISTRIGRMFGTHFAIPYTYYDNYDDAYDDDTYARDTYARDTYARDTYDDIPDLVSSDTDSLDIDSDDMPENNRSLWSGMLVHIMQDTLFGDTPPAGDGLLNDVVIFYL